MTNQSRARCRQCSWSHAALQPSAEDADREVRNSAQAHVSETGHAVELELTSRPAARLRVPDQD